MSKQAFAWPNGRRIAVTVTVMLETWSEGKPPPYGVQATPLKPGTVDHGGIAWGSYGGKVGVWRIIDLLNRHHLRGTFCVNAKCAELFPEAVAAIVKSGHDVAGHGYVQDELLAYLAPEEEKRTIHRCLDILEKATGQRPLGWLSPRAGLHRTHANVFSRREVAVAWRCPRYRSAARNRNEGRHHRPHPGQ
jgi:allantoinase